MRRSVLAPALFTLALTTPALAGEDRGGNSGGGGGRLGQVSGGIAGASHGSATPPPATSSGSSCWGASCPYDDTVPHRRRFVRRVPLCSVAAAGVIASVAEVNDTPQRRSAKVEGYIGAQKVFESDGAWTAELSIREGRFRLAGTLSRYFEQRADGNGNLTMTLPSVTGGVRIDDGGATKVFLEAGVAGAVTHNDPVMDSSITGVVGGLRVEHRLARKTSALFEAQRMFFENDIRATSLRAGLRLGFVQASFRVLDFNVGPALYGPEIGLRF